MSKRYLIEDIPLFGGSFFGGGVTGLVALSNKSKNIDYYACDTFSGVVNISDKDSFFKGNEYNDTSSNTVNKLQDVVGEEIRTVKEIFQIQWKK